VNSVDTAEHESKALRFEDWCSELDLCARCGKCRLVCPVFQETLSESMVARGRIELAEAFVEGRLKDSKRLEQILGSCIKCLRCASECPSSVPYSVLITGARNRVGVWPGSSMPVRFALRHIVPHRRIFAAMLKTASLLMRLWPGKRNGRLRHLPLLFAGWRWLPQIVWRQAVLRFDGADAGPPATGGADKARTVAFFAGCLTNYVYPRIAESSVRLLERAGYRVIVPKEQVCCGTPALSMGDLKAFRRVAAMNRDILLECNPDVIVTPCATCGSSLKNEYEHILGADPWRGVPVRSVVELLAEAGAAAGESAVRVTYHDPCHLAHVRGVRKEPRLLLDSFDYVEMREADRCCGGGGTFTMLYPDLSEKVSAHKVRAIEDAAPDVVATACPGCIMHLEHLMADAGQDVMVKHVVEVLEDASAKECGIGSALTEEGG